MLACGVILCCIAVWALAIVIAGPLGFAFSIAFMFVMFAAVGRSARR